MIKKIFTLFLGLHLITSASADPDTPSDFEKRAGILIKLSEVPNFKIDLKDFILHMPKIDYTVSMEDIGVVLQAIHRVTATDIVTTANINDILPLVKETVKTVLDLFIPPPVAPYRFVNLQARLSQWTESVNTFHRVSHDLRENIRKLASDLYETEIYFYELSRKPSYSSQQVIEKRLEFGKLLDPLCKTCLQKMPNLETSFEDEEKKAFRDLASLYQSLGYNYFEAGKTQMGHRHPSYMPSTVMETFEEGITFYEKSINISKVLFDKFQENEDKTNREDAAYQLIYAHAQQHMYWYSRREKIEIPSPKRSTNLRDTIAPFYGYVLSSELKSNINSLLDLAARVKEMNDPRVARKTREKAKIEITHIENSGIQERLSDNNLLIQSNLNSKDLERAYIRAKTEYEFSAALLMGSIILFSAGLHKDALTRFNICQPFLPSSVLPLALGFKCTILGALGELSEILPIIKQYMMEEKEKRKQDKKDRKIKTIKEQLQQHAENHAIAEKLPVSQPHNKRIETSTKISDPSSLLSEDHTFKDEKAEKLQRHFENEKKREARKNAHHRENILPPVVPDVKILPETKPTITPGAFEFYLTGTPLDIHEKIEENIWSFTQEQFKLYLTALGCKVKKSRGKGGHQGAVFPDMLIIKNKSKEIIAAISVGGFLTLPKWEKFVPYYLRDQISALRDKIGAVGEHVHKGQRPAGHSQQITAIYENGNKDIN